LFGLEVHWVAVIALILVLLVVAHVRLADIAEKHRDATILSTRIDDAALRGVARDVVAEVWQDKEYRQEQGQREMKIPAQIGPASPSPTGPSPVAPHVPFLPSPPVAAAPVPFVPPAVAAAAPLFAPAPVATRMTFQFHTADVPDPAASTGATVAPSVPSAPAPVAPPAPVVPAVLPTPPPVPVVDSVPAPTPDVAPADATEQKPTKLRVKKTKRVAAA